jgi:hypothetical protein
MNIGGVIEIQGIPSIPSIPSIPNLPEIPDIPKLPGVPALAGYAADALDVISSAKSYVSGLASGAIAGLMSGLSSSVFETGFDSTPAPWGIYSDSDEQIIIPDTILDIGMRSSSTISDFPVEEGQFASYNKVQAPDSFTVRMTKGGSVEDRETFLADVDYLKRGLDLVSIVTPEKTYVDVNITDYSYRREQSAGAGLMTVDIDIREVRQVTASYTSSATQNAQNPASVPIEQQGKVLAQDAGSTTTTEPNTPEGNAASDQTMAATYPTTADNQVAATSSTATQPDPSPTTTAAPPAATSSQIQAAQTQQDPPGYHTDPVTGNMINNSTGNVVGPDAGSVDPVSGKIIQYEPNGDRKLVDRPVAKKGKLP